MMSILELLDAKGIDYKDTGGDILIRCLNPEHIDSHPSLRIDRESGVMHCLSCGFGRGIPSIHHYFNEDLYRQSPRLSLIRKKIQEITRGSVSLSIPDSASLFSEDYRGISASTYQKYFAFQDTISWEDRIVIPITDSTGRIILFSGRRFESSAPPKYLVKPKDISPPVFPMRFNAHTLVLVEGLFDMLNLEDKGLKDVSACFGTHQFSSDNVADKLATFILSGTKVIVILLDNDKSGKAAADKLFRLIRDKTRITPIIANQLLPDSKDPGDLTQEEVDELHREINNLVANTLTNDV